MYGCVWRYFLCFCSHSSNSIFFNCGFNFSQISKALSVVPTPGNSISPWNIFIQWGAISRLLPHVKKLNLVGSIIRLTQMKGCPPCPFTCSFYAFWPQINWSESRKSTKQRVKGRERESLPANPDCSWTGLVNGACGVALLTVLSRSKLHAAIIRKSSSYGNACYANTIMNNYVHAPEYIYFSLFSRPELSLGRLWVESKVSPRGSPCEKHKSHVTATPTKAIFGMPCFRWITVAVFGYCRRLIQFWWPWYRCC